LLASAAFTFLWGATPDLPFVVVFINPHHDMETERCQIFFHHFKPTISSEFQDLNPLKDSGVEERGKKATFKLMSLMHRSKRE